MKGRLPFWERADADGTFGNRFDDPGQTNGIPEEKRYRIVYAATQREAAFAETIAHFRPDLAALAALGAIRGAPGEPQPLIGAIPARWRQLRGVGRLLLDPAHPDTLAAMRTHVVSLAVDLGHRDVDLSTITSGDHRRIAAAKRPVEWARRATTDHGMSARRSRLVAGSIMVGESSADRLNARCVRRSP